MCSSDLTLEGCFQRKGRERLLQSFSRRLGYLNDSEEARSICSRWLGLGGMLSDLAGLDEVSFAIFRNIAPVSPASTLESIQRAVLRETGPLDRYRRYLRTIRSLAYDPAFFEQCTTLLVKIIESGVVSDENDEGRRIFTSLFPLYFSGTQARIEKRLAVAKSLLLSGDSKKELLGLAALRATLEASHFGSTGDFEFGAHSRDFGWWPRTVADVQEWFQKSLQLAEEIALSAQPIAWRVLDVIAEQFRGLWSAAGMYDDLERVCRGISEKAFWSKGWIAVRQTMHYDSASSDPEIAKRLTAIEAFLKPTDLPQKVRSIVLPENLLYVGVNSSVDGTTDVQKSMAQVEAVAEELGRATANDTTSFELLLPELVSGEFGQLWHFGRGLAEETQDPRATWKRIASQVALTPREKQNVQVLRGFLNALNGTQEEVVSGLLDDAVEDPSLGSWYPVLQTATALDKVGVVRLLRSLRVGKARVGIYGNLVMGGVTHNLSADDFRSLMIGIASVQDGLDVAMELFFMRISHAKTPGSPDEISEMGCDMISRLVFTRRKVGEEYRLRGMRMRVCEDKRGKRPCGCFAAN